MVATDQYVQIEDVANYFAVSVSTIRAWLRQGYIPEGSYLKIGNTYRFKVKDVEQYLIKAKDSRVQEETVEVVKADSPKQLELDFNSDEDV